MTTATSPAADDGADDQELSVAASQIARRDLEQLAREVAAQPASSLPIIVGVMIDKSRLLTGSP